MNRVKEDRIEEQRRVDITNQLQMHLKSLEFFDDRLDDYIYIYDLAEDRVYFTERILDKFALPLAEDYGVDFAAWNQIIQPKDRPFVDHYRKLLVEGEIDSFHIAYRVQDKNGCQIWVSVTGAIRENEESQGLLLVGRITEMTHGRTIDMLTGLRSVEKFEENLQECQRKTDLKSIEADEVKIDRCFVDRVQHNAYNYRLLSNMIEHAHSARISVCCEGVETQEELLAVQELHTDLLQGFLFAKPCSAEEIERAYLRQDTKEYAEKNKKRAHLRQMNVERDSVSKELLAELRQEEIVNLVESMDEMIYVSDVDTHEMYYLNAAGRRITGIYDYRGRKCYEAMQGRDRPCEFCTNDKLCSERFYIWEKENSFLGRHYLMKDKLIPWQGKIARFEIALDLTGKENVKRSIQQELNEKVLFQEETGGIIS